MKNLSIEETEFGKIDGKEVSLFTLKNSAGIEVKITNYGGTITSLKVPDKDGKIEDIVLGFDNLSGYRDQLYLSENPFFGAIIGRYGNRISKGKFNLDGEEYKLATNNGPNHLHGGLKGFDKVIWQAKQSIGEDEASLKLHYISEEMEEGYPGNLTVEVRYTLTKDNQLQIDYIATTDKKTIVNLTNHSYFNLSGNAQRDILDHEVMINASHFIAVDENSIPKGGFSPVDRTPFDFRQPMKVGKRIEEENEQLKFGKGYDHCWVLNGKAGELRLVASVQEPNNGRFLEVFTTEPGMQFYSGNFLNGKLIGKKGVIYKHRFGLCLETQHYPNTPNQPDFPSVELKPGEIYQTKTIFRFSVK